MSGLNSEVGLPRVPSFKSELKKVEPPKGKKENTGGVISFEHSWQLILFLIGRGIRDLPKIIKSIILPLVVVTVINIVLESIPNFYVSGFLKTLLFIIIFLTSSYNSIIPRAIFWVIIFTIGKRLYRRIRLEGFSKVLNDYKTLLDRLLKAKNALGMISNYILMASGGLGFIAANFLTRNNRLDKVLVTYVIVIALVDTLSKGNKTIFFTALKLFYKDCTSFIKKAGVLTDNQVYIVVSGFMLGLLLNSIFGILKLDNGGYILGALLFIAGLILIWFGKKEMRGN